MPTSIRLWARDDWESNDEQLTAFALQGTMGEIVKLRETSRNARDYLISSMLFNAVVDIDIELIDTLVKRIDGTIQAEGQREDYETAFGDALDEVLNYTTAEQMEVSAQDTPMIAMAKAAVYMASQTAGKNQLKRKERNLAAKLVLERTGGRKVSPTQKVIETTYVEPDWMGLPEGGEDGDRDGTQVDTED